MLAFHGDPAIKAKYIARVRAHAKADRLVKGIGWERGKGCATGCTLEAYDHSRYPIELGIPEMLARLEDSIFEGLPDARAKQWPAQFLRAIEPGADLSRVGWKFQHWLLTRSGVGAYDHPLVRDVVAQCADVLVPLCDGLPVDASAAWSAASAAWSAANAAWSAANAESAASAANAARSAESAARSAANAAWSAANAESAAWSAANAESAAASAARSAESAAESAARSAARSAANAESAARNAAYTAMANQLLALLREASKEVRLCSGPK